MSDFIQCPPTPSDAELEAERDAKHARDVKDYFASICVCGHGYHEFRCGEDCSDPDYGLYACMCPRFRAGE